MVEFILGGALVVTWIVLVIAILNVHDRMDEFTSGTVEYVESRFTSLSQLINAKNNKPSKPAQKKGKKHA